MLGHKQLYNVMLTPYATISVEVEASSPEHAVLEAENKLKKVGGREMELVTMQTAYIRIHTMAAEAMYNDELRVRWLDTERGIEFFKTAELQWRPDAERYMTDEDYKVS